MLASACGTVFFTVVQGTIFNFLLEDLGLLDRLGFFLGLSCLAGIGSLVGAWIQTRLGIRKGLFLWCIGGSRLVWLAIGAIPMLWPDWRGAELQWPLAGLVLLFVLTHAAGANAWVSWMGDLVPPEWQGKYWGLRQVGTSLAGGVGRFAFGLFLDARHSPEAYCVVYAVAVALGVIDALLFLGVAHRAPRRAPSGASLWKEVRASLNNQALRRLIAVYTLWSLSNCMMGATIYRFARIEIEMGIFDFAVCELLALATFTAFSALWGRMVDHHGHRAPLVVCLLVHAFCPVWYFWAGAGDSWLVALAFVQGNLGFCGIMLFMWPLVIAYTAKQGHGRSTGMAAFTAFLGLPSFFVFWLTDDYLRPLLAWLTGSAELDSRPVFLGIFALIVGVRLCAVAMAYGLPRAETETSPNALLGMFARAHPLRSALNLVRYLAVGSRNGEPGPFAPPAPGGALVGPRSARAAVPLREPRGD
ncbi:MAG: MFS transporter [Planctomycetota bacterium]|nr:MFS transporter [Planctomycetota bacterium]